MKQYRIFAEFNGDVYADRQYHRRFYSTFEEAKADFETAYVNYKSQPYGRYFKRLSIQECEVPVWHDVAGVDA